MNSSGHGIARSRPFKLGGKSMRWPLIALAAVFLLLAGGLSPMTALAQMPPANYDTDGDGLIEIGSLAQLNAVRWDLDGDGTPVTANETDYAAAFPVADEGSVCPADTTCTGYELTANLDFDENGDGQITSADADYWNNRLGWLPIGTDAARFEATFEGNGHTIANLYVRRQASDDAGLFGAVGAGRVRNLRLSNPNVDARLQVGALAGRNHGVIANASAVGTVEGIGEVGGLVGRNQGTIERSYAGGSVDSQVQGNVGGLAGQNSGRIRASYAFGNVTNDTVTANNAGGLVGLNSGSNAGIVASYATGMVAGTGNSGGLVGSNQSGASIVASYATGRVTGTGGNVGGLVGRGTVTDSYYDTETSGRAGDTGAQTTAALQTPTGYTGIYADWNVDVDGMTGGDMPWTFGTAQQYPVLNVDFNGDGTATWQEFGSQAHADHDGDGLMEIRSLAQLNAVRWDLDGDGVPADGNATDYETAFNLPAGASGCPEGRNCAGYELLNNLDFDTGTAGDRTDDTYYNSGSGWEPIGKDTPANDSVRYNAVFDGNGHTIANLFINRGGTGDVGLFGSIGTAGVVRNLGVVDASVTAQRYVGALAGSSYGSISHSYASGTVSGSNSFIGGLVGWNGGPISHSYAAATVNSGDSTVGGLAGENHRRIIASYSTGPVTGYTQVGGLVGNNDATAGSNGEIIASYASGPVTGYTWVGGLLGQSNRGTVIASYATGPVVGIGTSNVGGLIGSAASSTTLVGNYYDSETTGRTFGVGGDDDDPNFNTDQDTDDNNVLDPHESFRAGVTAKTTAELQSPTAYGIDAGIYADWRNIDLNNDGNTDPEDTNDFWDFGTASQYPALKADFDGDNTATWPEFGLQLRQPLRLTATLSADAMRVALGWDAPAVPPQLGITSTAYVLYRDGELVDPGPAAGATSFQHNTDLTTGPGADYQLALLLDGREAARSNLARVGGHDRDGDGLIEISTLAQLNAIRWDLDGNGEPDHDLSQDNIDAFEAAFDLPAGGLICRDINACAGYELTANLDFDTGTAGDRTDDDYHNGGSGWLPIGDNDAPYNAVFDGNGHTIANLFIDRTTDFNGVFGVIGSSGVVRNVGVVGANISGISSTKGALAGRNDGAISNSYATGVTIGDARSSAGGLVGRLTGSITDSYASATKVEAGDGAGGLVGAASELSTITRSYATGSVSGRNHIGGLVGHVGHILGSARRMTERLHPAMPPGPLLLSMAGRAAWSVSPRMQASSPATPPAPLPLPVKPAASSASRTQAPASPTATMTRRPPGSTAAPAPRPPPICNRPPAQPASTPTGTRTIGTLARIRSTRPSRPTSTVTARHPGRSSATRCATG